MTLTSILTLAGVTLGDEYAKLTAMDALLEVLATSDFSEDYMVRGSYVARHFMGNYSRICQDLDLMCLREYDANAIVNDIRKLVCKLTNFDPTFEFESIWENSLSPGIRLNLHFTDNAKVIPLQVDISSGDPIVDSSIVMIGNLKVKSVGVETLAAWKLHGLFEHLHGPWQSKTLWDLYVLCLENEFDRPIFIASCELAFSSRLDPIEIMSRLLYGDFGRSAKSNKNWERDFPTFTSAPFIALQHVIDSVKSRLCDFFSFPDSALLTLNDIIAHRVKHLRELKTPEAANKLKTLRKKKKLLGHKAYYRIEHIRTSRLGPAERCISIRQQDLLCNPEFADKNHVVLVQEKLDGSCVCALRKNDEIFALGKDGDLADSSPNLSRRMWAEWVRKNEARFLAVMTNNERICGEWMAMVHGTHYNLPHEPFVAFDLFDAKNKLVNYDTFIDRISVVGFTSPHLVHRGDPIPLDAVMSKLGVGYHGAIEEPEGLMWRLERDGKPAFKAKYVRHDKVDGCFLREATGKDTQWNDFPNEVFLPEP